MFQKGVSGNPSGRARVNIAVRDLARAGTKEAIRELIRISTKGEKESDRISAIKELLDRAYGKCSQPLDGDANGGPIKVVQEIIMRIVDVAKPDRG